MAAEVNPFEEYPDEQPKAAAQAGADEEIENDTDVTKCPSCGANMTFKPEDGCLYCDFCGTKQQILAEGAREIDFAQIASGNNSWGEETHVFRCENCGAKEILDKNEIAKTCSFCGTSHVVATDELSGLKPNAVVPFAISSQAATDGAKKWARKKLFAPRSFKKYLKAEGVRGVYNPAFSFDSQTQSFYEGTLGKYYYVTRRVNGKTVRERRVRYFRISGTYDAFFDDVLIQASSTIDQKQLNKLMPFDTNDSKEYEQAYLSGFVANRYEKEGTECWGEARATIEKRLRSMILSRYTYDVVQSLSVHTNYSEVTYKYLLLPVYVGHFNFRKKLYNFFVNGRNGKITGKTPVSPWRVLLAVLLGAAVVVGLYFLVQLGG